MAKMFHQALANALENTGIPLSRVAREAGVSYEQLKKVLQRGASTNVDDAVKVANFFGYTLDEFVGDETAIIRSEIVDLYNQLSAAERRFLQGSAKGIVDSRDSDCD